MAFIEPIATGLELIGSVIRSIGILVLDNLRRQIIYNFPDIDFPGIKILLSKCLEIIIKTDGER